MLLAVLLSFGGAALAALLVPHLPHDTSLEQLFPSGSAAREKFAAFDQAFGTDDTLVVVVTDTREPAVFRPGCLEYLDRVVAAAADDPAVDTVLSVANLDDFEIERKLLLLAPGEVHPYLPPDRSAITAADIQRYRDDPLLAQGLLSEDGRSAACWILLQPELRRSPDYLVRVEALAAALPEPPADAGLEVALAGFPLLQHTVLELLWRDGVRLLLGSLVVVAVGALLGGVGRRAVGALLLAWPVVVGLLCAGFLLTGRPLHVFSNTLLPLLLITSASSLVHLGRARQRGRGLAVTWRAALLTTLTTSAGFFTLSWSPLEPLASLGEEVAAGAWLALLVQAWFLRLLVPVGAGAPAPRAIRPRRTRLLSAGAALGVVAALPWFLTSPERIGVLGDLLEHLPEDHPRVEQAHQADRALGAQASFEVVLELPRETAHDQVLDARFLLALEDFEQDMIAASEGRIAYVLSPVTLLRYLNTKLAAREGIPPQEGFRVTRQAAFFAIPYLLRGYLALMEDGNEALTASGPLQVLKDKMRQLLSADGRHLRFGCRIPHLAPRELLALAATLETEVFPSWRESLGAADLYATGYSVLVAETSEEVVATQLRSLRLGGLVLALLLALVARSFGAWLAVVAVNVATLLALANLMWLAGAPLNLYSTVLTASLLAVIVDDTIHLLVAWRHARTSDRELREALAHVGRSVWVSSLCLAAGFAVFALSEMPVYRQFAWNAVAGILLALLYDGVLLPFLLWRLTLRRLRLSARSTS